MRRLAVVVPLLLVALACDPQDAGEEQGAKQTEKPAEEAVEKPIEHIVEPPPAAALTDEQLAARYAAAVADAKVAEESEIYDQLLAIATGNTALKFDEKGRVLAVTWTNWNGYDGKEGQELELGVEVWVTMAPQLQNFCQNLAKTDKALDLRLEQLLGLPPNNGKTKLVSLWLPTDSLFRPSPDAEINDSVAALAFPDGTAPDHVAWIEKLQGSSYGEKGYPWTRLGYTYDWAPDATSEVGLSEYVVRKGTMAYVESVLPQAQYCARPLP
jgi:hypothetical protein